MSELKPCPFCGEKAYEAGVADENKVVYCAYGKCAAFNVGYAESVWQHRPTEAILTKQVETLQEEQLKFYKADGSFEVLESIEAVTEARKGCAMLIESQAVELVTLRGERGWLIEELNYFARMHCDDITCICNNCRSWRLLDQLGATHTPNKDQPQTNEE